MIGPFNNSVFFFRIEDVSEYFAVIGIETGSLFVIDNFVGNIGLVDDFPVGEDGLE